jgi:hypothetical protein
MIVSVFVRRPLSPGNTCSMLNVGESSQPGSSKADLARLPLPAGHPVS